MVIVLAHWAEHLAQAFQIYVLGWPSPEARGVLGLWYPVAGQVGVAALRLRPRDARRPVDAAQGLPRAVSRKWWTAALGIQFWHHIEHGLLQGQAVSGHNLFGSPVPISIVQLWIPRVELHLFYNTIVFIPMVVGMYYHMFPPRGRGTRTAAPARGGETAEVCSV